MNDTALLHTISNMIPDVVDSIAGSTPLVNARKRLPTSGLLYQPDLVLTVDHGVEKEEGIEVFLPTSGVTLGKLVGRDSGSDLALIRLEKPLSAPSLITGSARVGMPTIMIARPAPEGHQASFGIVTMIGGGLKTANGAVLDHYVATDATPYPGFSGGPLISLDGKLLGINTSGLVGGLSLAIPILFAMNIAGQLEKSGKVKRGFLGIRSQRVETPENLRHEANRIGRTGLLIVGLEAGGPAVNSGLMIGDILVGTGENQLADQDDLMAFLSTDVAGKSIPFRVIRGGQLIEIMVKVGER